MTFTRTIYFKIFAVLFFLLLVYNSQVVNHNKDFDVFIQASKNVFEHKTPYNVWFHSGDSGLKYFYSPLFASLLYPLKEAPQWLYNLVWFLLNLFFIYRIFKLLEFFLPLHRLSEKQRQWFYILSFVSVLRFLLDNLDLGQMTFFLVWGSMESFRLMAGKKYLRGAALLALIINIKLIPLALLAYLVYKGEWKAVIFTFLFLGLYTLLPAFCLGYDFNLQLHKEWLGFIGSTNEKSIFEDDGRPGLSAWIPALLMQTPLQYGIKRNLAKASPETVMMVLNLIRLTLVVLLAYLFGRPFSKINSSRKLFYDLACIALITPIFFPHQGKYAMYYLVLPYSYVIWTTIRLYQFRNKTFCKKAYRRLMPCLILSFALVTLTTDGLIGKHLRDVTEYLNLITYGVLALLVGLVMVKPKRKERTPV